MTRRIKDFAVEILWRRKELGFTQAQMAKAIGVHTAAYGDLETLRRSPRTRGGWSKAAIALAHFHCAEPEELFPDSLEFIKAPVAAHFANSVGEATLQLTAPLCEHGNAADLRDRVRHVLGQLTERERGVIEARFGLTDEEPRTLRSIGEEQGVQQERIRQIEAKALRKLRYPTLGNHLRPFVDADYARLEKHSESLHATQALPCQRCDHILETHALNCDCSVHRCTCHSFLPYPDDEERVRGSLARRWAEWADARRTEQDARRAERERADELVRQVIQRRRKNPRSKAAWRGIGICPGCGRNFRLVDGRIPNHTRFLIDVLISNNAEPCLGAGVQMRKAS